MLDKYLHVLNMLSSINKDVIIIIIYYYYIYFVLWEYMWRRMGHLNVVGALVLLHEFAVRFSLYFNFHFFFQFYIYFAHFFEAED